LLLCHHLCASLVSPLSLHDRSSDLVRRKATAVRPTTRYEWMAFLASAWGWSRALDGPAGGSGGCQPSLRRPAGRALDGAAVCGGDRKSTRLNSSHQIISYAVFCLKK